MSPEAQRIAISNLCGWKEHDSPEAMALKVGWTMPEKWCLDPEGVLHFNHDRPDYLNDLNAMHEAEKVIPQRDRCLYPGKLIKSTGPDIIVDLVDHYGEWSTSESTSFYALIHATASQRAEAFLRTLGKWVPGE